MKVQAVDAFQRIGLEKLRQNPQPRAGGARVVNLRLDLRVHRIDAQAAFYAATRRPHLVFIPPPLAERIEHNMIDNPQVVVHLVVPVGRGAQMHFLVKILPRQLGLVQAAGRRPRQILPAQPERTPRKPLECQRIRHPVRSCTDASTSKFFRNSPRSIK